MRRVKWGVGGVVVLALAWVLSTLFPFDFGNFGLGQKGDGAPDAASAPEEVQNRDSPEREPVSAENPERAIGGDGVLDVRIADRSYYLRSGQGEDAPWRPVELDSVTALAETAPGNDLGIRVRVHRAGSARYSAEAQLEEALREAGLAPEEILFREQLGN